MAYWEEIIVNFPNNDLRWDSAKLNLCNFSLELAFVQWKIMLDKDAKTQHMIKSNFLKSLKNN